MVAVKIGPVNWGKVPVRDRSWNVEREREREREKCLGAMGGGGREEGRADGWLEEIRLALNQTRREPTKPVPSPPGRNEEWREDEECQRRVSRLSALATTTGPAFEPLVARARARAQAQS